MRLRTGWPRARTVGGDTHAQATAVRPTPASQYVPAVGFLSKPADRIPRRRQSIQKAYDGLPSRAGLTMPAPVGRPSARMKSGWPDWKFGVDPDNPASAIPTGGPPELAVGVHGFGVPAIGNITMRPRYEPPAPIVQGITPGRPNVPPRPGARMNATRRLSGLLPNPQNLYQPERYGDDYTGTRGPAGRSWLDSPAIGSGAERRPAVDRTTRRGTFGWPTRRGHF